MSVIWTPQAIETLNELVVFLSKFIGVDDANKFQQELIQFTHLNLSNHPERNPPCNYVSLKLAGYRCMKFKKKYVIVYRKLENSIRIIGVGSSKRDPEFFNNLIS